MRTVFFAILFALVVALSLAQNTQPATQPTPTPLAIRHTIAVRSMDEIRRALDNAAVTPDTTIDLDPTATYSVDGSVPQVRGLRTCIKGNGATLLVNNHYTGTGTEIQGVAFVVAPGFKLDAGNAVELPYAAQPGGLWCNPAGSFIAVNNAAGGTPDRFDGIGPCQLGGIRPMATFKLFRPILTPADGITISNLKIKFIDPQAQGAFQLRYAKNCRLEKIVVVNRIATSGNGGMALVGSEGCEIRDSIFPMMEINYSNDNRVSGCTVTGALVANEGSSRNKFDHNQILCGGVMDLLCVGNSFIANRIGNVPNYGSLALRGGTGTIVIGNLCDGGIWFGGDARRNELTNNAAPAFADYAIPMRTDHILTGNSWQK